MKKSICAVFHEEILVNLEKLAQKIESNASADPSVHKVMKKLQVNDLPLPDDIGDTPDIHVPKKFPVKCASKGCCFRHGNGTKVFLLQQKGRFEGKVTISRLSKIQLMLGKCHLTLLAHIPVRQLRTFQKYFNG